MKREASNSWFDSSVARLIALVVIGSNSLLLLGCGSKTYEDRLAKTQKYFRYRETLNLNLERQEWKSHGIEIRVPLGFRLEKGPAPVQKDENNPDDEDDNDSPPVDPRQPSYVNGGLPSRGIVGAW